MRPENHTAPPSDTLPEGEAPDTPDTAPHTALELPEEDDLPPPYRLEDEDYPEDFALVLFEFIDYICQMEAHIDAANECLHAVRARMGNEEECDLNDKRAYYLLDSIYRTARQAALRAHEVFPKVVAYCEEQKIKMPDR